MKIEELTPVIIAVIAFSAGLLYGQQQTIQVKNQVNVTPNFTKEIINNTEYNARYKADLERPYGAVPQTSSEGFNTDLTDSCDRVMTVEGKSMRPMIWSGDKICMERVYDQEKLERGQIVTVKNRDGYMTHMIDTIYRTEDRAVLRGVNNPNSYDFDHVNLSEIRYVVTQVKYS